MKESRIRLQHLDSRLAPKDTPNGLKVSSTLPEVCIKATTYFGIVAGINLFIPGR
jgi:hypothetical protein